MSGYDWKCFQGFGGKSTFNGDISKWDTGKVTNMQSYVLVRFCVQPRHWELEHRESDYYACYVSSASSFNQDIGSWNTAKVTTMDICFIPLLRSTTTFPRGPEPQRRRRKLTCFPAQLRFKRNFRAPTPSPVLRIRAKVPRQSQTRAGILLSRNVWLNLQRLRRLENV